MRHDDARHPLGSPARDEMPPRYAPDRDLPPYAYVPGRHPHPVKHPQGHAFERVEPPPVWPETPGGWASAKEHRAAIDLFNQGFFWEAHEAWEALWHVGPHDAPERLALQGLIQAAAGLLKRGTGQTRPGETLARAAAKRIEAATHRGGSGILALDLLPWLQAFEAHMAEAGAPFPYLRIRDDGKPPTLTIEP